LHFRIIIAEDDENSMSKLAFASSSACVELAIDFLDQTGQGIADFARENQSDQIVAVHSHRATLLPGMEAVHEQRTEPTRNTIPDLRPGLHPFRSGRAASQQQES
jgi:hypothetical protein